MSFDVGGCEKFVLHSKKVTFLVFNFSQDKIHFWLLYIKHNVKITLIQGIGHVMCQKNLYEIDILSVLNVCVIVKLQGIEI